jgi:hypothetical protein
MEIESWFERKMFYEIRPCISPEAMLRMFKFFPEEFVPTFASFHQFLGKKLKHL